MEKSWSVRFYSGLTRPIAIQPECNLTIGHSFLALDWHLSLEDAKQILSDLTTAIAEAEAAKNGEVRA